MALSLQRHTVCRYQLIGNQLLLTIYYSFKLSKLRPLPWTSYLTLDLLNYSLIFLVDVVYQV